MRALYLTHPQVQIDPDVPVPQWGLSAIGRTRAEAFAARALIPAGAALFASAEHKAVELAAIIGQRIGSVARLDREMGENDRSATGFLPPERFEATADRFFAHPLESIEGWERAFDAQARIVAAVTRAMAAAEPAPLVVFCGHGAVGTLLKCYLGGWAIARSEDQSRIGDPGGGNGFAFDLEGRRLHCDWTPLEALTAELVTGSLPLSKGVVSQGPSCE
ncbi:histidine phosphatase family protein [uncultured Devosia sp.]|uniref:histidine phosphatase family protein n=1 Tax=uncultured Devosia sp. TaxID=211434 RepID=UPI0035C9E599